MGASPSQLQQAAEIGALPTLHKLIVCEGQDVNTTGSYHRSLLQLCLYSSTCRVPENRGDIAKYLLESGGNVNHRDIYRRTALHYAVILGDPKIVQLLLEKGANPELRDESGLSPIDYLLIKRDLQASSISSDSKDNSTPEDVDKCELLLQQYAKPDLVAHELIVDKEVEQYTDIKLLYRCPKDHSLYDYISIYFRTSDHYRYATRLGCYEYVPRGDSGEVIFPGHLPPGVYRAVYIVDKNAVKASDPFVVLPYSGDDIPDLLKPKLTPVIVDSRPMSSEEAIPVRAFPQPSPAVMTSLLLDMQDE